MHWHRVVTVFVSTALMFAATPTAADAQCLIRYRMTTNVTLGTLLMTSNYSEANGEFVGEFGAVVCTNLSSAQPIFNDNEPAELLGLTFFAMNGLNGPTDLAECEFEPNGSNPVANDFVSAIDLASDSNGSPVNGVEVVVSNISCEGAGSTTTSTTLPSVPCGDPDSNGLTATDALFILASAVGLQSCQTCICDVDSSGTIAASDALLALQAAVGGPVTLVCVPCV